MTTPQHPEMLAVDCDGDIWSKMPGAVFRCKTDGAEPHELGLLREHYGPITVYRPETIPCPRPSGPGVVVQLKSPDACARSGGCATRLRFTLRKEYVIVSDQDGGTVQVIAAGRGGLELYGSFDAYLQANGFGEYGEDPGATGPAL